MLIGLSNLHMQPYELKIIYYPNIYNLMLDKEWLSIIRTLGSYLLHYLNKFLKFAKKTTRMWNYDTGLRRAFRTFSFVGNAGIAPLSVTVNAPQALANLRDSLNCSSFCMFKPRSV